MQLLLRHKLLIAGATVVVAASAGAAYAATQSATNPQQAFIQDVAKRLHVSPAELTSAVKAALIDRINEAVKAGKLTQAQANQLEQRINQGGRLPFFFGAPGLGHGPQFFIRPAGGALHAAASYLGVSDARLIADLASGKSLAQVAQARGKSVSGLEQTLITAATKRLDQLQSRGVITKAQEQQILSRLSARVSKLVNRTGFAPMPGKLRRMMVPGGAMPPGGPMMPPAAFPPAAGDGPPPTA